MLNIQEATGIAMKTGKTIRRSNQFCDGSEAQLIPTNICGYILYFPQKQVFTPMWNPMAEDLLADDWEVLGD